MDHSIFLIAAEPSADLHGASLIAELKKIAPSLSIHAVAGPRMRELDIHTHLNMEHLQVMGFIDVLKALPKMARHFFAIRSKILSLNPDAVITIDYPGFNLRLHRSLRKKGFKGKLIHYICPTVWAWGKKRILTMEQNLDLLLTIFPFEPQYFSHTSLMARYVGHPLTHSVKESTHLRPQTKILGLFPGSRTTEIERNFPIQLRQARKMLDLYPSITIAISVAQKEQEQLLRKLAGGVPAQFIPPEENYRLMRECHLALATSGTVTLELALHNTPTIVHFAIRPLDVFIAQRIFNINLSHYCIVNIIANKMVFPELFGPNLTEERLHFWTNRLWFDDKARTECRSLCKNIRELLGNNRANETAAQEIGHQLSL